MVSQFVEDSDLLSVLDAVLIDVAAKEGGVGQFHHSLPNLGFCWLLVNWVVPEQVVISSHQIQSNITKTQNFCTELFSFGQGIKSIVKRIRNRSLNALIILLR